MLFADGGDASGALVLHPFVTLVVGAALGAFCKYLFDSRIRRQPSSFANLRCTPTHNGFLTLDAQQYGHSVQLIVDGNAVQDAGIVNYRIEYSGNVVVKNVKLRLRAEGGNQIINWFFTVAQDVICERLKIVEDKPPHLKWEWAYLNPGDSINLEVTLAPCTDPNDLVLEVDAEGLVVQFNELRSSCTVPG